MVFKEYILNKILPYTLVFKYIIFYPVLIFSLFANSFNYIDVRAKTFLEYFHQIVIISDIANLIILVVFTIINSILIIIKIYQFNKRNKYQDNVKKITKLNICEIALIILYLIFISITLKKNGLSFLQPIVLCVAPFFSLLDILYLLECQKNIK